MKRNCKNLLARITTLAVLAWLTGCGQSHEKQAAAPLKPPIRQELEKARPQALQLKPVQVTENTRQTYQWYCPVQSHRDNVHCHPVTTARTRDNTVTAVLFSSESQRQCPLSPNDYHKNKR